MVALPRASAQTPPAAGCPARPSVTHGAGLPPPGRGEAGRCPPRVRPALYAPTPAAANPPTVLGRYLPCVRVILFVLFAPPTQTAAAVYFSTQRLAPPPPHPNCLILMAPTVTTNSSRVCPFLAPLQLAPGGSPFFLQSQSFISAHNLPPQGLPRVNPL